MFKGFLSALLQKILIFLKSHNDFVKMSDAEKIEALKHLSVPHSFKEYLLQVSEKSLMTDIELILQYVNSPKKTIITQNSFFKAFNDFLVNDLGKKIDYLDGEFYLMPKDHRNMIVEKLISTESLLAQALRNIMLHYTYQQLVAEINNIGSKSIDAAYIMVQSPREIDIQLKKEIRDKLQTKYPNTLPVFQINKNLIGGIRIFENGQVVDESWLSRVLRFTSLTTV